MNFSLANFLVSPQVLAFSIKNVVTSAIVVAVIALVIGILLGIAAKVFHVKVDERELMVRDLLPGNNCGGCGFAGCDALAKAIVSGSAPVNGCPVASSDANERIGKVMGADVTDADRFVAFVKCNGTCDKTERRYQYNGIADCKQVMVVPGSGEKACTYGCCGYGSCVNVCEFDAIHIVNGVAVVDKEKCVACGKCVTECPKHIIELVPEKAEHVVMCSSLDKGKDVKAACSTGCIACTLCVRACAFDAIHMENNLAKIDYSKCTNCGKCATACPQKIILHSTK